jgi:hypothetical protein
MNGGRVAGLSRTACLVETKEKTRKNAGAGTAIAKSRSLRTSGNVETAEGDFAPGASIAHAQSWLVTGSGLASEAQHVSCGCVASQQQTPLVFWQEMAAAGISNPAEKRTASMNEATLTSKTYSSPEPSKGNVQAGI